jgi:hypothetical protein
MLLLNINPAQIKLDIKDRHHVEVLKLNMTNSMESKL